MATLGVTRRVSPLIGWLASLATTVGLFFAGNLLGTCDEHPFLSRVWAILLLGLMVATLALSVWAMFYHARYWFLVLPLVLATAALCIVPFWISLFVLGGCDFGDYQF